jgi:hypothetical protein
MVYTAGTRAVGGNAYGDGTVYRGVRSKDSEVPTLDVQSTIAMWQEAYQGVDAKLDELETLTKRLALDLECVMLNSDKWWDQAHATLQAYRDLMDRWYPQDQVSPLGKD